MSSAIQLKSIASNEFINFQKKSKKDKNKNSPFLGSIGALINIIWFLCIFLNPPIDPLNFVMIGFLSFLLTVLIRFTSRIMLNARSSEIQSGGSIVGFVFTWVLVQFYSKRSATVIFLGFTNTVDQFLSLLLIGAFFIWFLIPSKKLSSQELMFNFPPLISYFIINLWKLLVILKFLIRLWNLNQFDSATTTILLVLCIIEILGMYQRILKLDITDIILDVTQIFSEVIKGPLVSIKWSLLLLGLILLNFLQSDVFILVVLGFSLFMSFISLITFISKLSFDSGLIQRKASQTKSVAPQIFSELKDLKVDDFHENYYQVMENFQLRRKTSVKSYSQGDILFRIPLQQTIETVSGIYIANISFDEKRKQRRKRKNRKINENIDQKINENIRSKRDQERNTNLQIKSVGKFTKDEWIKIVEEQKVRNISSDAVIQEMGFKDKQEFDKTVDRGLKNFAKIQDNVRDRIRGVPTAWNPVQSYIIESFTNELPLPEEILENLKKEGVSKLEIIPGKDEFLFYVKKKS